MQLRPTVLLFQFNPITRRLTGQTKPFEENYDTTCWVESLVGRLISWLSGSRSDWESLAVIGKGIAQIDPSVDLSFTSYISPATWPSMQLIDEKWTKRSWIRVKDTIIEPDDWDLFWKLWNEHSAEISGRKPDEPPMWKGVLIYKHPSIDVSGFNYNNTVVADWTAHFPKMFEKIQTLMPWHMIEKIVVWQNVNEIQPHFDPDSVVYPWPDSLRIMLWDSNEEDTFYMAKWPERDADYSPDLIAEKRNANYGCKSDRIPHDKREYIKLKGTGSNTFLFNNGAFLHGADMAKPKIIMAVKGRPQIVPWLQNLEKLDDN